MRLSRILNGRKQRSANNSSPPNSWSKNNQTAMQHQEHKAASQNRSNHRSPRAKSTNWTTKSKRSSTLRYTRISLKTQFCKIAFKFCTLKSGNRGGKRWWALFNYYTSRKYRATICWPHITCWAISIASSKIMVTFLLIWPTQALLADIRMKWSRWRIFWKLTRQSILLLSCKHSLS